MEEEIKGKVVVQKLPLQEAGQYLGLITLNRPQEMNPLDGHTAKELGETLKSLSADKGVCVIAITGAGRAFSAGGDMKAYLTLFRDEDGFRQYLHDLRSTFDSIGMIGKPVIALVNGYCVAGGLELMLACDFAYAANSAKIGDGHVATGQVGGAGSNVRLPRWISPPRARELLFTGKLLSAEEALQCGLVNRVLPDDKLLEAGLEFANVVATKSSLGIRIVKEICNLGSNMRLEDALHLEIQEVHHYAVSSHDSYEGLLAFSEKRPPKFEGR